MREITCPSGLKVCLRDYTPPVVRLVQPNVLLREYQEATEEKEYTEKTAAWFRRLEKIIKVIVADPPIFIPDDIDDPVPPGHLPTYELSDEDIGYILGEWLNPIYRKMETLEENAGPLSQTPTQS